MKKLFLCILTLIPFMSQAQKYEIGLNGGMNYCATPAMSFNTEEYSLNHGNGKSGYAFSASIARNLDVQKDALAGPQRSLWQVGLKLDVEQVSARGYMYDNYITLYGSFAPFFKQNVNLADPAIAPVLFVNRKMNFTKSRFYYGINAGGVYAINKHHTYSADAINFPDGGTGYTVGLQVGYTQDICKHFSLNAEISPRYYSVYYSKNVQPNSFEVSNWRNIATPLTIGMRYTFGKFNK